MQDRPSKILTKEFLEEQYIKLKKPPRVIKKEFNIKCGSSIWQALKRHNIPRMLFSESMATEKTKILTKEFLYNEYVVKNKTSIQIAKDLGYDNHAMIFNKLKKYGIPVKTKKIKNSCTKKQLEKWYLKDKLSLRQIGTKIGHSESALSSVFKKLNIKIRDFTDRKYATGKEHFSFTGYGEIPGGYICSVKATALKRKIEYNVSSKYIWYLFLKQKRRCIFTNEKLIFCPTKTKRNQTASLDRIDRIDSSKGYIKGNLQWTHKDINRMKWEKSNEDFIKMCKAVASFCKD